MTKRKHRHTNAVKINKFLFASVKLTSPVVVDIRIRPCLKHKTLYFCDRNMKEKEGNGKGKVITETVKELNFSGFFDCVYL